MKLPAGLCALLFATALHAAPFTRDLGRGLQYFRVQTIATDLPAQVGAKGTVLDLRYANGDTTDAKALAAWATAHASATSPLFALANDSTASELRQALADTTPRTSLIVIGPASAGFHPDIAIRITAEAERRAYEALTAEADLAKLISANPTKTRYDEAAILEARTQGDYAEEEPTPELNDTPADTANAPVVDLALQRAVQLQHAWFALAPENR